MKRQTILPVLALFCSLFINTLQAQVDLKINPIGVLFNNLNAGIEFGVKDNFGIEVTPGFGWNKLNLSAEDDYNGRVLRLGLNGRYYFNPTEKGLDGFYIGAYSRYAGGAYTYKSDTETQKFNSTRLSAGFLVGRKVVARNERLIFDFGIGFGRAFIYEFDDPDGNDEVDVTDIPFLTLDIPLYLTIGYRLSGSGKD